MESETIKRLSEFLPRDVRLKILGMVPNQENLSIEKDMAKILALALQNCPEAKEIIKEKVMEELKELCMDLSIIGEESKTQQLLKALNDKDKTILTYLWKNRHSNIRDISRLISAPTDAYTLTRIREVINPLAQNIMGKEILEFNDSKIDPVTGEKKMFNWWLAEELYSANQEEMLDIFDEGDCIRIVTQVPCAKNLRLTVDQDTLFIFADNYKKRIPLFYQIENVLQQTYKNDILEIKLKKR